MTHTQNMKVPEENIEFNNGWRKHQWAGAEASSLSMIQHYTDVKLALLLCYITLRVVRDRNWLRGMSQGPLRVADQPDLET